MIVAARPGSLSAADWNVLFAAVDEGATAVIGPVRPSDEDGAAGAGRARDPARAAPGPRLGMARVLPLAARVGALRRVAGGRTGRRGLRGCPAALRLLRARRRGAGRLVQGHRADGSRPAIPLVQRRRGGRARPRAADLLPVPHLHRAEAATRSPIGCGSTCFAWPRRAGPHERAGSADVPLRPSDRWGRSSRKSAPIEPTSITKPGSAGGEAAAGIGGREHDRVVDRAGQRRSVRRQREAVRPVELPRERALGENGLLVVHLHESDDLIVAQQQGVVPPEALERGSRPRPALPGRG